jgi:hypothetical protein
VPVVSAPKEATAIKAAAGAISFANAFIFVRLLLFAVSQPRRTNG